MLFTQNKTHLSQHIKLLAKKNGFHAVGITSAEPSEHIEFYNSWLDKKYFADMNYLENHQPKKSDLKKVFPDVQSVVCVALSYKTKEQNPLFLNSSQALISNYAWGDDYHIVMEKKLKQLLKEIQTLDQSIQGRYYVDTGPVLERSLAERAGIGWMGKNTMVMDQSLGSYIFLGEILLNCDLNSDQPQTDHCGTCTKCIEACPTDALVKPYELDARKCISYLTIEKRGELSQSESEMMGPYVFGCDICQVVCPWNDKAETPDLDCFKPREGNYQPSLASLEKLTPEDFSARFRKSPVKRTKYKGFMRNVTVLRNFPCT
jgi:epoxyqueuosine reductase